MMRRWLVFWATLSLGMASHPLSGQSVGPMMVLIGFSATAEPWDVALAIASTTGMKLVGVSPGDRSALYLVREATDAARTTVAANYEDWVLHSFPGMVSSFNYGSNLTPPTDLQGTRPATTPTASAAASRFSSADRLAAMSWSDEARRLANKIRVGMPIDPELKSRMENPPPELVRRLAPLPSGSRYVLLMGALLLLDGRGYVQDVIRF